MISDTDSDSMKGFILFVRWNIQEISMNYKVITGMFGNLLVTFLLRGKRFMTQLMNMKILTVLCHAK